MPRITVPLQPIQDAIEAVDGGDAPHSIYLNDHYVSRGMYGDGHCFGIVSDSSNFFSFLVELANIDLELARKLAMNTSTDDMGQGTIYYFRRYQLEEGGLGNG